MSALLRLRERLADDEPTYGTFLNLGSPLAGEIAGIAGFDWAILDLEHGSGSEADLLAQLYALQLRGVVAVVRVEANDRPRFSFALDKGAQGIMVPRVEDAGDAVTAVGFLRYPPDGIRGVATLNRACEFGRRGDELIPDFNESVLGVIQIESPQAVESADAIAAMEGVDVLFIGPTDLSHALGVPGDTKHPRFRKALRHVVTAARDAGKTCGILVATADAAARFLDEGVRFIAVGADSSHMLSAMTTTLSALRSPAVPRR